MSAEPVTRRAALRLGGIEWYIIEYQREAVPPLESLKANPAGRRCRRPERRRGLASPGSTGR